MNPIQYLIVILREAIWMLTNVFFATIVHISKRLFKRIQQENNEQRVHDIIKHVPLIPDTGKSVLMFLPVSSCSMYQQLY